MEPRTHEERRADALEVLDGFMAGEVDPERSARAMHRRHGALGSYAVDVVMGDVWARPQLSRRDRSLIVITVLATIGSTEELSLHTMVGLNNGLTRTEIEEIMLHVACYGGFPMAMQATRVMEERFAMIDGVDRLPPRGESALLGDLERRARACDVRQTLTGGRSNPADGPGGLGAAKRLDVIDAELFTGPDEVLVQVNGAPITRREFLARAVRQLGSMTMISEVVKEELFLQEAERRGIEITQDDLDREVESVVEGMSRELGEGDPAVGRERLANLYERQGLSLSDVRRDLRRRARNQLVLSRVTKSMREADTETREARVEMHRLRK